MIGGNYVRIENLEMYGCILLSVRFAGMLVRGRLNLEVGLCLG
mgnify:FL=1